MTHDISIVTAFFDIGRASWQLGGQPSTFRRSSQQYLTWFENLAPLKNSMVIFTEKQFAEGVFELRRTHGLESATNVMVIDDLFAPDGPLADQLTAIRRTIRPELHSVVRQSRRPGVSERRLCIAMLSQGGARMHGHQTRVKHQPAGSMDRLRLLP